MFRTMLLSALCVNMGCAAHAHTPNRGHNHRHNAQNSHRPHTQVNVNVGWVWKSGHWSYIRVGQGRNTVHRKYKWIQGHWYHNVHGVSYRSHSHGPPSARSHADSMWVQGHWAGHGPHRRWIPGHWRRI